MTIGGHISQQDLISYAMQEISEAECAPVRLHLRECASCRAELARTSGDFALIAMSVEQHPLPEGARQRFLHRIANPIETAAPRARITSAPPMQGRSAAHWTPSWVPWGAVAALLVIAIALGARLHFVTSRLDQQMSLASAQSAENLRARKVLEVLTAPAAQHVLLTAGNIHPAPSARAVYLASRGELILQASNLKPLDVGKAYELWLIPANGAQPVPAGVFHPDALGSANMVLPQIPEGIQAKAFGVTIENAGGSATPTAPIILSGATPNPGE